MQQSNHAHPPMAPQVAHDLRSRLNALTLALDVLETGTERTRAQALVVVRRNAQAMSELIDQASGTRRSAPMGLPEPATRVQQGTRVLVVEDEYMLACAVAEHLTHGGCQVVGPAGTIDDALDLLAQGPLDCAVLDVNLGGVLSTPIAERLAAAGVPVVALSGYDEAALPAAFVALPFLQKPVVAAQLLDTIAALTAAAPRRDRRAA